MKTKLMKLCKKNEHPNHVYLYYLLSMVILLSNAIPIYSQAPRVYSASPSLNYSYYKRNNNYYSSPQYYKVGYYFDDPHNYTYLYRKAFQFNLNSIAANATIDSCRLEYYAGPPLMQYNGRLVFTNLRWDFAILEIQEVFDLIQSSSEITYKDISSSTTYNSSLTSLVSTIQSAIQSAYKYIGLGVYNYYEDYEYGTTFSSYLLKIYYKIPTPPAVTSLAYSNTSAISTNISWSSSGNVTGYKIKKDGTQIADITSTNYTVTGLCPGTPYQITVIPYNSYGDGDPNSINCTTLSYSISGSNLICISSNATFSFINRPSGVSITWTKSDNLQEISGKYTDNYTVSGYSSGSGWVKATLSSGCQPEKTYSLWVGTPVVTITGPAEGCTYTQHTFQAHTADPNTTNPFSYSWDIYPYDGYISTSNGGNYAAYAYITFYSEYSVSGYQVKARAENSCGTGNYGQTNIWIYDCYYFMASPNPASETVTIYRTKSNNSKEKASKISLEELKKVYTIKVVDFYGTLYYNEKKSGESFTIPIHNLKDGSYLIQLSEGKNNYSLQLIVKH